MQTESHSELMTVAAGGEEAGDSQTAGYILSQERQRLGLNEKEVADQLHITMHYVKALESNSYEKLPGAVFAKGYLKSYALLLGLDVEDLLSRYDVINDRKQADIQEASRLVTARRKKDRNKPLVIVSLVVFVGGFLSLWLVNSFFGVGVDSPTPATVVVNGAAESVRPAPGEQGQLTLQTQPEAQQATPVEYSALESESGQGPPALASTDDDAVAAQSPERASGGSNPEPLDLVSVLQAVAAEQAADVPAAQTSAVVEEAEQPRVITIEAAGNDVLRLSFTGESWVEVNDSESQQIYRDIREAGDVLEITGSAPFNILLGDAPFTRLSLNGNEIDLSSDIRIDNSARLTVGL